MMRPTRSLPIPALVLFPFFALGVVRPAEAQVSAGVRAGVSGDPDQFVFGGHVETKPLIEHLTFRPNVELGVGDNVTLASINLELAYWIPIERTAWSVYVGAGPAVNIASFSNRRGDETNVGGGFNVLFGVQHDRGLFTEVKVGAMDSPSIRWVVGYVFKTR